MSEEKRVIEINGMKLEVDLSKAKRIDEFRIGDNIKVLRKAYSTSYDVDNGVIVDFVNFNSLPTIQIAMFKQNYNGSEIQFLNYNAQTKDIEISACSKHELTLEKNKMVERLQAEIDKKKTEVDELKNKLDWFNKFYGKYFTENTEELENNKDGRIGYGDNDR